MAEFRSIHTKMWRDEWFSNLPPEGKVLFVYLITNPAASVCGMYQLPNKFIAFDTGLSLEQVQSLKEQFKKDGKIDFDGDVIWVKKMREYQDSGDSPKVAVRISKDLQALPNCRIKGIYCEKYGIDRVSVGYPEKSSDTDTDTDTDTKQKHGAAKNPAAHSEFQNSQQVFISQFCKLSGIPEPDHKIKQFGVLWGGVAARILKALDGSSSTYLERAISKMRHDGLTISTPASVEKVIMALYGEDHSTTGQRVFNDD